MAGRSVGTKLVKGSDDALTEVTVAELTEIGGLDLSADTIDITALDSTGGYREFIGGFKDGGEVSVSGFFNIKDAGQKALYDDFKSGLADQYDIRFPVPSGSTSGAIWQFRAVVTGFSTSAAVEDAISFEGTLKVSGEPTLILPA